MERWLGDEQKQAKAKTTPDLCTFFVDHMDSGGYHREWWHKAIPGPAIIQLDGQAGQAADIPTAGEPAATKFYQDRTGPKG